MGFEFGVLLVPAFIIWLIILVLPWRPWSTRESLDADPEIKQDLSDITVLIPARDEEEVIGETLSALMTQGKNLKIILIDDHSCDKTARIARHSGLVNLKIIEGQSLPEGWSGKLWALEQGRKQVKTSNILLLDADIKLKPGTIATLLNKMEKEKLDLISLMAFLRMEKFWEKLLMPAFIYFFKLLYPFSLSNTPTSSVAAAAGGCILIKRSALESAGGFASIKNNLIDDCTLAETIKKNGGKIWLGLTHSAMSLRDYNNLRTIWDMVARTAYTQLKYSILLLLGCTLIMVIAFIFPIIALFSSGIWTKIIAMTTLASMLITYLPTLKYYSLNFSWSLYLPLIGVMYLLMTWSSAYRHIFGGGSIWKDRNYGIHE